MPGLFDLPKPFQIFAPVGNGSKGKQVRLIQELLCLIGFPVAIDGDYGPATESAVRQFQEKKGLNIDGMVFVKTFEQLIQPLERAIEEIPANGKTRAQMVVEYAQQHLSAGPREVGGQNRGPWVRLYMKGREGNEWPWCAGFVSYILGQACKSVGCKLPFQTSFSCDLLATNAMKKGAFIRGHKLENKEKVHPGSIFLSRRAPTDWVHAGIVVDVDLEHHCFRTIEGNTNDNGCREGYEACERTRGFKNKDFILI